jgi:cyclin-dependent kinase 12/13
MSSQQAQPQRKQHIPVPSEWYLELPAQGYPVQQPKADPASIFGPGCRRIEDAYERVGHLGQGTYGEVFKARDKSTGELVAVKRIKMENEKEGFPITAVREIKILSMLAADESRFSGERMNEAIIKLREVVRSDACEDNKYEGSVYMVFDYMAADMAGLLERAKAARLQEAQARGLAPNKVAPPFKVGQVKRYMWTLLVGLQLLQNSRVLHRDLKNANLLVSDKGELKIADFGLARQFYHDGTKGGDGTKPPSGNFKMTSKVITLWYRPPELVFGTDNYGAEVDIWSAGCIMTELLTGKPLFPARDEIELVKLICNVLGMADDKSMPGCKSFKDYDQVMMNLAGTKFRSQSNLRPVLVNRGINDKLAIDLLESLLALDPSKRISASEAVKHPWFSDKTHRMLELHELPKYEESHELSMRKKKQKYMDERLVAAPGVIDEPPAGQYRYMGGSQGAGGSQQGRTSLSQRSQPRWQDERR